MTAVAVLFFYFNLFTVKNPDTADIFTTFSHPEISLPQAFMTEPLITTILAGVIFGSSDADLAGWDTERDNRRQNRALWCLFCSQQLLPVHFREHFLHETDRRTAGTQQTQ